LLFIGSNEENVGRLLWVSRAIMMIIRTEEM